MSFFSCPQNVVRNPYVHLVTFCLQSCKAESVESVERRTIASEEVALLRHFKVAKMRTLDTRRQLTVLKLKSIISNL